MYSQGVQPRNGEQCVPKRRFYKRKLEQIGQVPGTPFFFRGRFLYITIEPKCDTELLFRMSLLLLKSLFLKSLFLQTDLRNRDSHTHKHTNIYQGIAIACNTKDLMLTHLAMCASGNTHYGRVAAHACVE